MSSSTYLTFLFFISFLSNVLGTPAVDTSLLSKPFLGLSRDNQTLTVVNVLKHYNFPDQKIQEMAIKLVPAFNEALMAIFNEQDLKDYRPTDTASRFAVRSIFGDIVDWIKEAGEDVGCGVFAAGALPGYLAAAGIFAVEFRQLRIKIFSFSRCTVQFPTVPA